MRVFSIAAIVGLIALPTHSFAEAILELPPVDPAAELATVSKSEKLFNAAPVKFAVPRDVAVTPKTHGDWSDTDAGREWRLRVQSDGATDLNFGFGTFVLPQGASLELMVEGGKLPMRYGPYTNDDATRGEFWSPPLPGGDAVLILSVPDDAVGNFELELSRVGTGFRDLYKMNGGPGFAKQGACNNDVVCAVGDGWRDEIRSVAAYTVGGTDTCTGTMIMDAGQTFKPFFLTAYHCSVRAANAASVVTIWNYESVNCGDLSGGSRMDTVSGSTFRAGRDDVDSTLLELSGMPPESYGVHWAGWDRSDVAPNGSVGIHHPAVDEKAISFNTDPLTKTNSCIGGAFGDTHWEVDNWEDGTTEPGSSGSALFDPTNKRVIGFLSGGSASCSSLTEDCYGRFGVGWTGGSSDSERFSSWLDPDGSGIMTVAGSDPGGFSLSADTVEVGVCAGQAADFEIDVVGSGDFSGAVNLAVEDRPTGTSAVFATNPVNSGGSTTLTIGNTSGLATDSYPFSVTGTSGDDVGTLALTLAVADASQAPSLTSPSDGSAGVSTSVTVTWADNGAQSYDVQIATDIGFNNIVASATVSEPSYSADEPLDGDTTYYWRVRGTNGCGNSAYSTPRSFTTGNEQCLSPSVAIPDDDSVGVSSTYSSVASGTVSNVQLQLGVTHTWVGDLVATLRHDASGVEVSLLDRPGIPASSTGCNADNIDVLFDDAAASDAESACATTPPAIDGTLRPFEPLAAFAGVELAGDWTLTVSDNAGADTGTLNSWCFTAETGGNPGLPNLIFEDGFE